MESLKLAAIILLTAFKLAKCRVEPADIFFLLDSSGSVGQTNFMKMIQFVETLVEDFDIGPNKIQVGVITFDTNPRLQFHLKKYSNKREVVNAIQNINYNNGGSTYTNTAFEYVRKTSFTVANGARQNAAKIAIIITDGNSENPAASKTEAQKLRNEGVTVFSVGVGSGPKTSELEAMATDSQHVFSVNSFKSLKDIKSKLQKMVSEECQVGYYGYNCSKSCNSGCSGACNKKNGYCTCKPGWTEANCGKVCPSRKYGSYCLSSCSAGCEGGTCDKENGNCSCKPGYQGHTCDSSCISGRYGAGCTHVCSEGCKQDTCDSINGTCECVPGWTGEICNEKCKAGQYGVSCSFTCSSGCSNNCTGDSGTCTCKPGWKGGKCDTECPAGTYGLNCNVNCASGCEEGMCHRETGHCTCRSGWQGIDCQRECVNGTYGADCKHTCSVGCADTCSSTNGTCYCVSGYFGNSCIHNLWLYVGVTVGSAGFALLIIAVFSVFYVRRKRKRKESILRKTTTVKDVLSMQDIQPTGSTASGENEYVYVEEYNVDQNSLSNDTEETDYQNVTFITAQKSGKLKSIESGSLGFEEESTYGNVPFSNSNKKNKKSVGFDLSEDEELYENFSLKDKAMFRNHADFGPDDIEEEENYENVSSVKRNTKR